MILDRDKRQDLGIEKWKEYKCKATCLYPTGFGKTRVAMKCISRFHAKNPEGTIIVIVPTDNLRTQWGEEVTKFGLDVSKITIMTVHSAIKKNLNCSLLIVDEVHMMVADTFKAVFTKVKYKIILCMTGTIDRLDGKQHILKHYAPICDTITLDEAIENKWVADYKHVKILINVDLTEYKQHNKDFLHYFSYFDFDFNLAMSLVKDFTKRITYANTNGLDLRVVNAMAMGFNRSMKARKAFVYDHPKKIEIVNKIINARPKSKIITFTKSKKHAEQICCGVIYHGSLSKKKKEEVMKSFNEIPSGVMNTCKAVDVGTDVSGVDTAIIISGDSSSITKKQRIGRAIRVEGAKVAFIYSLVLKGTVEEEWFRKSSSSLKTTAVIEDHQLNDYLEGKSIKSKKESKTELIFRF